MTCKTHTAWFSEGGYCNLCVIDSLREENARFRTAICEAQNILLGESNFIALNIKAENVLAIALLQENSKP